MQKQKINTPFSINAATFIVVALMFLLVTSCSYFKKDKTKGKVIAKVADKQLTLENLIDNMPKGLKTQDSLKFTDNFINSWVRQALVIKKAEDNLSSEQMNVDKQLETYRNSLVIYAYEKELVNQKLDTVVTDSEIEKYYNEHPSNFELKENIIKVIYIKVAKKAPNINKLKEWYKLSKEKDRKALEDYCYQFADNFFLDDNSWLQFSDLLKEIPIETYNQEQFLQNNRYVELQDSLYDYFVNIRGFKIKDSVSPLSFEKQNISNIILNKRKVLLINKMREDTYQEALKNNGFEVYK